MGNTELFEKMGVLTPRECEARKTVLLEHYVGSVEMEAMTMVDMINQHVIPSCKKAELGFVKKLEDSVKTLKKAVGEIHGASNEDEAEGLCPPSLWTLASYSELLFLDTHPEGDRLM